jgi:hypothetical protein
MATLIRRRCDANCQFESPSRRLRRRTARRERLDVQ